jgi:hypothetical protein
VPWYSFAVLRQDGTSTDAGSTILPDGQAAHHYGTLIIRELKNRGKCGPGLRLVVKSDSGEVSHDIPFF